MPQIATRIELYTGTLPDGETDLRRVPMRRLGHLSFDRRAASVARALCKHRAAH